MVLTELPDWIDYDAERRVLTIYGVKYAEEMFAALSFAPPGKTLRIVERADGVVTVEDGNGE
jgi:hypothetical protein